jgi:hypothetical protein
MSILIDWSKGTKLYNPKTTPKRLISDLELILLYQDVLNMVEANLE